MRLRLLGDVRLRLVLRPLFRVGLALAIPVSATAQAWVPQEGQVQLSLSYQFLRSNEHLTRDSVLGSDRTPLEQLFGLDFDSTGLDLGDVSSHVVVLDSDIGITDRLAVSAGLAFVQAKYEQGGIGSPENPAIDNGQYHGTFQDVRLGARYIALDGNWKLTPMAAVILPTNDYATLGHAAIGRGLKELQVGASVGRLLSFGGEARAYIEGDYLYAWMENPSADIAIDRSNLQLSFGYFYRSMTFQLFGMWQGVHGGIDWAQDLGPETSQAVMLAHDRAAATQDFHMGGTMSYEVNDATELYVALNNTMWGANTHAAKTLTFGLNFGFQGWGSDGHLGMWGGREDPNPDLDDWLLDDLDPEKDDEDEKEPTRESSRP